MSAPATAAAQDASAGPLGTPFTKLWLAAIATNLGDGLSRVAVPLLAVSLTRDPLIIAVLGALSFVPWLLFGIHSGVVVDRLDRRRVLAAANALRLVAGALLAGAVLADAATLWLLAAATFVFGLGEVLADTATNALLPAVVKRSQLDVANGRIQAAQIGVDTFIATPLGGILFAVAAFLPIAVSTGAFGAVVILALALPAHAARARRASDAAGAAEPIRVREGAQFLWRHRYLRDMTMLTSATAALLTFAQAPMVITFVDHFAVPAAAIGLVAAGVGVGGLAGALLAPALVARFGRGRTMLVGTVLGGVGLCGVGLAPNVWVAVAAYGLGAFGVGAWNVPWGAVRQSLVPQHMLGRVTGLSRTIGWALIPVATVLGGLVARVSLTLPFVVGGAAVAAIAVLAARLILSTDEQEPAETESETQASAPAGAGPVEDEATLAVVPS